LVRGEYASFEGVKKEGRREESTTAVTHQSSIQSSGKHEKETTASEPRRFRRQVTVRSQKESLEACWMK